LIEAIVSAILQESENGCPVAPSDSNRALEMAQFSIRRLRSQKRRKIKDDKKVADLAKALARDFHKNNMKLVGRTMRDYEALAEVILAARLSAND